MSQTEMSLAGMRCLVLDDEYLIALDIQTILEAAGAAAVICAANAVDALAAISDGVAFDLAVLDLKLGGAAQTSATVAEALAKHAIPFVFLTGIAADDTRFLSYPGAPVVEKPYQAELLLGAVFKALTAA